MKRANDIAVDIKRPGLPPPFCIDPDQSGLTTEPNARYGEEGIEIALLRSQ
jgi:hypothetical protein